MTDNHSQLDALLQSIAESVCQEFGDTVKVCRDYLYERFDTNRFSLEVKSLEKELDTVIEFLERLCQNELGMKMSHETMGHTFTKNDGEYSITFIVNDYQDNPFVLLFIG